jgi:hypothetical protein
MQYGKDRLTGHESRGELIRFESFKGLSVTSVLYCGRESALNKKATAATLN